MRFWCSTLEVPWTWVWRAYPGVWLAVLGLAVPYFIAVHRRSRSALHTTATAQASPFSTNTKLSTNTKFNTDTKQSRLFAAGVAAFWLATDWPLGLLGASYLASAHMVQFMLYTLVAAPLMVAGTPEWMARRLLSQVKLYRLLQRASRPVVAGVVFNALLIATHSPWAVDTLRANQLGSFLMDVVWLAAGLLVWLPLLSPLQEHRMRTYPTKMVYLFTALGVVPAVPAGFLTFAGFPLYSVYELAPRFYGLSATTDQQLAGLIMKLGGIPIVWGLILVMMFRWADTTRSADVTNTEGAVSATGTADVTNTESARGTGRAAQAQSTTCTDQ